MFRYPWRGFYVVAQMRYRANPILAQRAKVFANAGRPVRPIAPFYSVLWVQPPGEDHHSRIFGKSWS